MEKMQADLCIIGSGYAGVCAYDAACQYLKPGSRVIVVDRNALWGGQWIDQYDFVRLHQPYQIFTAGSREWAISKSKPPDYLANKTEILSHLRDIVAMATSDSGVELVELFGFEYIEHHSAGGAVEVRIKPCPKAATGPNQPVVPDNLSIRAARVIKAIGLDVEIKRPLRLTACNVHSISPKDVLSPHWKAAVRFSDKPIFVIGSGKTAMDVINHFAGSGLSEGPKGPRVHCVSGRGTWFINRDRAFPLGRDWGSFFERNFGGTFILQNFLDMLELHDGDNELEVYREMGRRDFFHSPIPHPRIFALGILSTREAATVRATLGDRILKKRLMDVATGVDGQPVMRLRSLNGTSIEDRPIPAGSFVINCTDSLFTTDKINRFEPILSDDGLVCSPQTAVGFTGPGADIITHAWYLGTLERFWRELPRPELDPPNKHKGGMMLIYLLTISSMLAAKHLPMALNRSRKSSPSSVLPQHRLVWSIMHLLWKFERLHTKAKMMIPGRWYDTQSQHGTQRFSELDQEPVTMHSKI